MAIGGGLAANNAAAAPTLPKKSPQQLVKAVAGAHPDGLSGTVTESANLGLPSLPGQQQGSGHKKSGGFSSLLSGTHDLKVWTAGQDKSRVALLDKKGEADVIRNGNQAWLWSSAKKSATHLTFPRASQTAHGAKPSTAAPNGIPATPQETAQMALDQMNSTTKTSVDRNVTVAGRSAYQLVLKPKDSSSLVSKVRLAVDAKTSTALRAQVFARGQDKAALSVSFRTVDFSVPDAKNFHFSPPSGAKVIQHKMTGKHAARARADSRQMAKASKTVGKGWTQVQVSDLTKAGKHHRGHTGDKSKNKQLRQQLKSLPKVSGSWGSGHLLKGSLFSAVLTDHGRLAVGPVKPAQLYKALDS